MCMCLLLSAQSRVYLHILALRLEPVLVALEKNVVGLDRHSVLDSEGAVDDVVFFLEAFDCLVVRDVEEKEDPAPVSLREAREEVHGHRFSAPTWR